MGISFYTYFSVLYTFMLSSPYENYIILSLFIYRMTISHDRNGPLTKLNLKSIIVQDEDTYICETTFIEPMESCDNTGSYSILLKVNGK